MVDADDARRIPGCMINAAAEELPVPAFMRDKKYWAARVEYVLANEGAALNHIVRPANVHVYGTA